MMRAVAGLSPGELSRVRGRLVEFTGEMFESMVRKDQRRWGEVYLRGLMLDGKRKSIEPMAARLADGDEQCLQQFVNQSPWDEVAVRRALARRMSRELAPEAWVIDDTGFPKFGKHSVGVARQYSGALGKVGNCQIGVSVNACSDEASCPLDWRLFIPKEWDEPSKWNRERRAKAKLPDDVHHVEKWRLALEMIDELVGWGLTPPVMLGDGAYGDITEFRSGLEQRELAYVLDVKGGTSAYPQDVQRERPEWKGTGRPPKARYREDPSSLKHLALDAGKKAAMTVTWREGTRGKMSSRFLALRVRPANEGLRHAAHKADEDLPVRWLICEWPSKASEPTKYWLSNLPADTPLKDLVRLGKLRWRIEHDYRELKDALGLDHFEGRTYRGWNHHVTLVSVAHAFLTLERERRPPTRAAA
ncbi:MAG TPA: IS701 family transposase [Candidatus Methylomirabilis sp.]|nr:IS701 family transposase [Candidatus Methylomirabilis sp.]